ncbi:MAG: Fe(2+)-trafficking protein [Gemmataceae bacterium]
MNELDQRITQFEKMANDDPENELGHFRLGKLYMEAERFDDAVKSLNRTLELSPQFSKVYELLGSSLMKLDRKDDAIETLKKGFEVADERGDNIPRDAMADMLVELGQPKPEPTRTEGPSSAGGEDTGFRCATPGCPAGTHAAQLPEAPFPDELGEQIHAKVCGMCWSNWLGNLSVKVINELHLDLSTDKGQDLYDQYMKETLGLD